MVQKSAALCLMVPKMKVEKFIYFSNSTQIVKLVY